MARSSCRSAVIRKILLQICAASSTLQVSLSSDSRSRVRSQPVHGAEQSASDVQFCTTGLGKAVAENSGLISALLTTRSEVFRKPGVRRAKPACWCVQQRLAYSVGGSPIRVKVRSSVAWIVGRKETESREPIDKAIFRMVSESSGRNESTYM